MFEQISGHLVVLSNKHVQLIKGTEPTEGPCCHIYSKEDLYTELAFTVLKESTFVGPKGKFPPFSYSMVDGFRFSQ